MNGLSLCSGIAGIELGLKLIVPEYRVIGYVEREAYAAANLATRMEEGYLDTAPIYSSLEQFPASLYRGKVDIVTAGLPCQPFSLCGKRERERDSRHLWPLVRPIIKTTEPALVFLENVHISAFREPWRDLREMGFSLPDPYAGTAAELGAGHLRRRVFLLAYSFGFGIRIQQGRRSGASRKDSTQSKAISCNPEYRRRTAWAHARRREARDAAKRTTWWESEPGLARLVSRAPNSLDRTRAVGESCVPIMAACAFAELIAGIENA